MEQDAAALGIRQVAERAGLVHGTFYNYYQDIDAMLDGLAELLFAAHALTVAPVRQGVADHAALFANTSRQTLRLVLEAPQFARLLFDSGIPADRLLRALHEPLRADIRAGVKAGSFKTGNVDLAVTICTGAMMGMALDLHRRRAKPSAIEELTAELLRLLGVAQSKARMAASVKLPHPILPGEPLTWKALGLKAPESSHAA